ncbi:hypothetical protein STEG23_014660 [Scotinomys teguina]
MQHLETSVHYIPCWRTSDTALPFQSKAEINAAFSIKQRYNASSMLVADPDTCLQQALQAQLQGPLDCSRDMRFYRQRTTPEQELLGHVVTVAFNLPRNLLDFIVTV